MVSLSGCVAASAVSGTAVDSVVHFLQGKEESIPRSSENTLAAVQKALQSMDLAVQLLEPVQKGYLLEFTHQSKWTGIIEIERETSKLTTLRIRVRNGIVREDAIERAIVKAVQQHIDKTKVDESFNFRAYHNIREQPSLEGQRIGWYLPGSALEVSTVYNEPEWLRVKMPSGKQAFLKGSIQLFQDE
ncbi:MAG: hypothetical protein HQM07_08215 [Zetaproteobacteria bacterium]|nr:hypothetical protein [Zetaproteobacteria bacterium]